MAYYLILKSGKVKIAHLLCADLHPTVESELQFTISKRAVQPITKHFNMLWQHADQPQWPLFLKELNES